MSTYRRGDIVVMTARNSGRKAMLESLGAAEPTPGPTAPAVNNVSTIPDLVLLERAVNNARDCHKRGWHPRWVAVMDAFALGRTFSCQLCERFNLNPDERVRYDR